MSNTLTQLDPNRAWAAYEPSAKRPWNVARAAHLYRRAGFSANWAELQSAVKGGPQATVRGLMADAAHAAASKDDQFESQMNAMGRTMMAGNNPRTLSAWWLYRMRYTPSQLLEKTTLFWHGHFATSAAKVTKAKMMLDQIALLRRGALGEFEPTVRAISRDPAMLVWLDSTSNRKIRPNENYARELMELFCLGIGNYTETDIKQMARAFTGWEVRKGKFVFNRWQHDTGSKSFLGASGEFDGDDAVRIVLEQPAASRFIASKLVRYFVSDEPALPDRLVEPLAKQLRENGFVIGPVVERILSSDLFFSEHVAARKVRSPVDLGIGLLRALEGATDMYQLAQSLDQVGQAVMYPPNVKGWDGGRAWISSSRLLGRANLVGALTVGGRAKFAGGGLHTLARKHNVSGPADTVDWLLDLLVATPVPRAVRGELVSLLQGRGDEGKNLARVVSAIGALPEFQLA